MSDLDVSDFGAFVSSSKGLDVSDFDSFISKSKPSESGDTWRGAKTAAKQLPQLGYGLIAGAGAVAESAFGEGGVSSAVKEFGVRKYQESGADIAKDAKETDSLTYSWDQAKQGNYGAMVDWLQYGIGYGGVQALEALASGGLGAVLGKATLKQAVEHLASGMVSKEVAKIVETEAGKKLAASAVQKMAVANVAANIGSTVGIGAQAFGMEGGEIMGGLAEQSSKEGRALTGAEIAKGLGATLAAGSLEFVGDKLGVDLMLGKSALVKPVAGMAGIGGRAARAGVGAIGAIPAEAGTEYFQTGIEEYGQGKEANILPWNQSPEAQRQAFDAAGLGGLGGGAMAVGGGLLSSPVQPTAKPADTPRPTTPADILAAAQTPDEAIAAFQGAVEPAIAATQAEIDAMLEDPLEDWASLNPIKPPRQFGALSQDPTGFGLQSELADLIAQEAQDVEQKRQALAEQQGIKRESDLETVYARVEGTRQAESRQNRLKLLDDIYANPDERTPAMTFLSRLRAEFPMNPEPTPEEKLFMSKRETAYQAFKSMPPDETDSGPVASPPNEGGDFGIKERKPNQPAPAGDRVRVAQALLTRKGNRIARDGSAIRNKDGKVLFTFRAGELDQVQSQPQGPSNASQAAETPLPVVPQEARQDEALPEQIAPTPEEVSAVQPALPEQVAQLPAVREQLSVEFGGQRYPVESLQDASAKWEKFRDETGAGVSDIGNGVPIFDQTGKQVAYVSYNGKVWQGAEYDAKAEPVYVPKEQSNPEASRPNPAPTPITAEPLSQTVVAPTQEKAAPAPKGAAVLAQRQQIAAQKFIESAGEQFGLSREEAGASLTKEQRKAVMQTLVDVYKTKGAPKESKGLDQNGNERSGYAYSPELFEKSDITGAPIRYVVTLPDGRIAHPTELFPDMTLSKVEALILEQKGKERDKAELDKFRREQLERRKSDTINEANAKFNRANPGLGLEFVPALLTDGKQFIRAHPDTVANDLRLLGRDWVEKPLGVNAQAQEAPQQTPADAGVSVSAGANVLDFAKGKKVTHKAIVAETGQVIELKNQDAVEAITDIQRDIDALEALKLCIGA